ncbi:HdeD family acid-resistance protein [Pseudobutyrivibrio sp.]|jgi:uncharacterized membrane protein HdeD (DUF308 family)|uniref:HdeD family acid-resistance protein n=1 Tax=Pseudobutyrivibrio sp. TaxID=2014367 RepID=UPI0025F3630A|nr:DUF308 domain-containing protein [Pseudobutyrivibrio sp.]
MKEKIKGLRLNITISAVISIIIGMLLMIFPTETTEILSRIIAGIIILAGVAIIISQIFENSKNVMGIVVGAILAILGIWMFMSPQGNIFINIIPIAIGVILVVHGVQDLGMAFEVLKTKQGGSLLLFIGAIVNIVLGLLCIAMAFDIITTIVWLIGLMMVFDGVTDIFFVHKVRKSTSAVIVDSTIVEEEVVEEVKNEETKEEDV